MKHVEFSCLLGKTIIEIPNGIKPGDDEVEFVCSDGTRYKMLHQQDCCESVSIEDVNGDWADLLGVPILVAEENGNEPDPEPLKNAESYTWTFYRIATRLGFVVIRWLGESNGYYSESVDFVQL